MNMELEPVQKPEFYPFIESIPNVIECNCVTGNYSMLMKVIRSGCYIRNWCRSRSFIQIELILRLPGWMDSSDSSSISKDQTQISHVFYLVSFLIDQADITVLQCSMPAAGEA